MKITRLWKVLFLVACISCSGWASDAILIHRGTLRRDPSSSHPPIAILQESQDVELIDAAPRHGYYHVRTADNQEGWIYARNLHLNPDIAPAPTIASPSSTISTTASSETTASLTVPPNWDKPEPNQTQFDGPDGVCGPTGDGGDTYTNARKNRTDTPAAYHSISWKAMQSLPYPVAPKSLASWNPAQLAQIQPYEGMPVSVVGYLTAVKVESGGSGESTNCHFSNKEEVDWHMPLVEQTGQAELTSVVVETTPRVRKAHPKWTPAALAPWVKSDLPVRISGWTLLDPEHRAHLGRYRSTLWEIHPITKIEVWQNGEWIDLDQVP